MPTVFLELGTEVERLKPTNKRLSDLLWRAMDEIDSLRCQIEDLRDAESPSDPYTPPCPPIEPIRQAAREVGYAVGEHGSKRRDYDLIAVPWTDDAVGNHALVEHLLKRLPELLGKDVRRIGDWARKPLGRYACTLQVDAWMKHIDLSIAPRASQPPADVRRDAARYRWLTNNQSDAVRLLEDWDMDGATADELDVAIDARLTPTK